MDISQKISMDTQNDGLEKESPLKYGHFEHLCSISRGLLMIIPFQTNQPFASVFKAPRRSPSDPCDLWDCNYLGFPPFHNNWPNLPPNKEAGSSSNHPIFRGFREGFFWL